MRWVASSYPARVHALVLALAITSFAASTSAQRAAPPAAPAAVDDARARNQSAVRAYLDGRFDEAAAKLEEAIALAPAEPVLHLNLGKVREALRDRPRAIDAYERYLALSPAARERVVLEAKIAELKREIAQAKALDEERAARPAPQMSAPPPPASRPSVAPFVLGGAGALGLGASAVLGVFASSAHDAAERAATGLEAQRDQDRASRFALASNVSLVAGAVLVVAGVVWLVVDLRAQGVRAPSYGGSVR